MLSMLLTLVWQMHKECDTFGVTGLWHDIKTHFLHPDCKGTFLRKGDEKDINVVAAVKTVAQKEKKKDLKPAKSELKLKSES